MGPSHRLRYLAPGEAFVLGVRRHVVVLAGPAGAALAGIVGAAVLGLVVSPATGESLVDVAAGLLALALVGRFGWRLWSWSVDRIVVTDRRVVEVSGLLTRKVATIPLSKVTDMTYRRTLPGRLLGYGDLILESAGQDQAIGGIRYLPHPDDFYRTVISLLTSALPVPDEPGPDDEDTGPLPRVIV